MCLVDILASSEFFATKRHIHYIPIYYCWCLQDFDNWAGGRCPLEHGGGFWFNACGEANLNGVMMDNMNNPKRVFWEGFQSGATLSRVQMRIKPRSSC